MTRVLTVICPTVITLWLVEMGCWCSAQAAPASQRP
jgi:hypothetical protein